MKNKDTISNANRNRRTFCGESNPNWKGNAVEFICVNCNKAFTVPLNVIKAKKHSGKFCTNNCFRSYQFEHKTPDIQKRLNRNMRRGVTRYIHEKKARRSWKTLVGYELDELMLHIGSQLNSGMTWDNYGAWHIDHIIPVSAFRFTSFSDPDFIECWKLSNLQPLWSSDNISKGGVRV